MSTRTKIVVTLEEPPQDKDGDISYANYPIKYVIEPYDKLRMQLVFEDELLWARFKKTIFEIEGNEKLQPKKVSVSFGMKTCLFLV